MILTHTIGLPISWFASVIHCSFFGSCFWTWNRWRIIWHSSLANCTLSNIYWWPWLSGFLCLGCCLICHTFCWCHMPLPGRILSSKYWISYPSTSCSCIHFVHLVNCNKPTSYCFPLPCSSITIFWPNPRGYKSSTWVGKHSYSLNPASWFNSGS